MLCSPVFKHVKVAWRFLLLRIYILLSLNRWLESSALSLLPFVLKRAKVQGFRALPGEAALRLLSWRIILTPESLLSPQICFFCCCCYINEPIYYRLGNVIKWWCFSWSFSSVVFFLMQPWLWRQRWWWRSRHHQLLFSHRNRSAECPQLVSSWFCHRRSRCAWHAGWCQFSSSSSWGIMTGPVFAHHSDLVGAFHQVAAT